MKKKTTTTTKKPATKITKKLSFADCDVDFIDDEDDMIVDIFHNKTNIDIL